PLYMPPEQLFADDEIDARADLYSLGAILFRALTGRPPFDVRSVGEVIKAHASDLRHFAAEVPETVPETVRRTVVSMLARDPAMRPESAEAALQVFLPHAIRMR